MHIMFGLCVLCQLEIAHSAFTVAVCESAMELELCVQAGDPQGEEEEKEAETIIENNCDSQPIPPGLTHCDSPLSRLPSTHSS